MKKTVLNDGERLLEKEMGGGEWSSVENMDEEIEKYRRFAANTLGKNKKINIRLSDWDYEKIKIKSAQEGLPYQTLIASLIHKYLTGQLRAAL